MEVLTWYQHGVAREAWLVRMHTPPPVSSATCMCPKVIVLLQPVTQWRREAARFVKKNLHNRGNNVQINFAAVRLPGA